MAGENINIPQRRSIRLKGYDYSQAGAYFITVCTRKKEHLLGKISDAEMLINAWGNIVQECWYDLRNHYPGLELDIFVVMPNHIHGIIVFVDERAGFKLVPTNSFSINKIRCRIFEFEHLGIFQLPVSFT